VASRTRRKRYSEVGAAQLLQEIDKAALVCPPASRPARAIRARPAARFSQFRLKMGENRAAVSVAVFSRFAIYANVVRRICESMRKAIGAWARDTDEGLKAVSA